MNERKSDTSGRLPGAQVFSLAGLVEYAEGSIVSRMLVKAGNGSVTLFAFDAGQELSEHTTPFDALVQVVDGTGEITIGGETLQVRAGETVVMPANVPHAVNARERLKMLLVMIRD